jgi:segregation and condensation protein A
VRAAELELDLEVFTGPFDLLLTLVLREEVDLLEVDLADVVLTYLDYLQARGDLDLEVTTEFLVLIAALLELKSRLMLGGEDVDFELELGPGEAAEELLARLLEAHRFRSAAGWLAERLAKEEGHRFRSAPLPLNLRRARTDEVPCGAYDPAVLGAAVGSLLRMPEPLDLRHVADVKVSVTERLDHLRSLLRRGSFDFDEAVARADRTTVAVALFALLELYKRGEATWAQEEPFAAIRVVAAEQAAAAPPSEAVSA